MTDLDHARHLIDNGVPIFVAKKARSFPNGGSDNTGYHFPKNWQQTRPDPSALDSYNEGDALCAIMGHSVDGLDLDPHKGGELPPDLRPISYGQQSTPSGGTHDLIAPLGVRSRDGVYPGVDLKAGVNGKGHGFLFIAPTRKLSKVTGEVEQYQWVKPPELDSSVLLIGDDSGQHLAERVRSVKQYTADGPSYDGAVYAELDNDRRQQADNYIEATLFDWKMVLHSAKTWVEGERDEKNRGWEALSRDAAWAVAKLAVCPWAGLPESEAHETYLDLLPEEIANDPKCKGKWYSGILEKAAGQPVDQPPWWSQQLFSQTETLSKIQDAAWSRLLSPESLLAMVLGRVLAEVPPDVLLPGSVVGDDTSLNLGVAIVAGSGGGKSSAIKISRKLLGVVGLDQENIEEGMGSGEGMTDLFLQPEAVDDGKGGTKPGKELVLKDDPRVILVSDEIGQMTAVGKNRNGSTLDALLRTALTGGMLATANAQQGGRYRRVAGNSYRLVTVVGVQPSGSESLLGKAETDLGTPQRFLWCSALDPNRPKNGRPEWPGSLDWEPPNHWPKYIEYPDNIAQQVIVAREQFLDGEAGPLEGHLMLVRLKIATALAVLHGEVRVNDFWWELAGQLTVRSLQMQNECREYLTEDRREGRVENEDLKNQAEEKASIRKLDRAAESVIRRVKKADGETMKWREARPAGRLREGLDTDEIITRIRELEPRVEVEEYEASGQASFTLRYKKGKK